MSNKNEDFSKIVKQLREFNRRVLPRMGDVTIRFIDERFREQNWYGTSKVAWRPRKKEHLTRARDSKERAGKLNEKKGRGILTDSGNLRLSIKTRNLTQDSITIGTDVPYAKTHNEGFNGTISQNVKQHSRTRNGRKESVKAHTRTVNMRVPKRQFMPTKLNESPQLVKHLQTTVIRELEKVIG